MKRLRITTLALVLVALACSSLRAADDEPQDQTKEKACSILKKHLGKIGGFPGGKPYPYWVCDVLDDFSDKYFFVILLRSTPAPGDGFDHLQNAGYWAVSKRGDLVLGYDLVNERIVPIPDAWYAKKPK